MLADEGLVLPGQPPREPRPRTPWPDWLKWKPNHVWAYDFTHFGVARRAALAIIDVVSRKWIITPDDEHTGRRDGIRQAHRDGLTAARDARINYRRTTTEEHR